MLRRRCVLPVVFVAATAIAPSARAAAPWGEPQLVPGAHVTAWEPDPRAGGLVLTGMVPQLGFTQDGTGFAVLGAAAGGRGFARFDGPQGAFPPLTPAALGGVDPTAMTLVGRSGVVLAGGGDTAADQRSATGMRYDAVVARGTVAGAAFSRQVIAKGLPSQARAAVVTALAANASGDIAVAVSVPVMGARNVVGSRARLYVRRRGTSRFRRVVEFARQVTGATPAALAVNPAGDVLLAWDNRTSVRARLITARGTVGAEQRLGTGGSAFTGGPRIVAAMDATRRMVVAWLAQRLTEGGFAGRPGIIALAAAAPGAPFGAQQTLERGLPTGAGAGVPGASPVHTAIVRDRAVVAWTGRENRQFVVRTADVVGGRVRGIRRLSAPGQRSRLEGLTVGPRGGHVVVWATRTGTPGFFAAARASGTQAWGPTEIVTTGGDVAGVARTAVAARPVSGEVVVLVSDPVPMAGEPPPPPAGPIPVRSVVRAAP